MDGWREERVKGLRLRKAARQVRKTCMLQAVRRGLDDDPHLSRRNLGPRRRRANLIEAGVLRLGTMRKIFMDYVAATAPPDIQDIERQTFPRKYGKKGAAASAPFG